MDLKYHPLLQKHQHEIPVSIRDNLPPKMAVLAKLTAKPGQADKLKEALAVACSLVRLNEPGVPQYHMTQSREDPHVFKMFEVYNDQAALDNHMSGTPYINELLPLLLGVVEGEPEVEWLDSILY